MGLDILEEREIKPDKLFPCETRPLGLLEGGQHQVITVLPGLGLSCTVSLLLEARALLLSSLCRVDRSLRNALFVPVSVLYPLRKSLSTLGMTTEPTVQTQRSPMGKETCLVQMQGQQA